MEEALRLRNQQYSDEGCSLSSLWEAKSILKTLATGNRDLEAFSALESESDNEHNVQSNYRNSHDTLDNPEEDDSEHTPTSEPRTTLPIILVEQQSKDKTKRIRTPPPDRRVEKVEECILTPSLARKAERTEFRILTPPPSQPFEVNTMPYPYSKYRDDLDAEAHV